VGDVQLKESIEVGTVVKESGRQEAKFGHSSEVELVQTGQQTKLKMDISNDHLSIFAHILRQFLHWISAHVEHHEMLKARNAIGEFLQLAVG